jgi:hypothetical protein
MSVLNLLRNHWPSLVIFAVCIVLIALDTGGFTYTLDDPYIHLAYSQRIAVGHFGMNAGEPSSPCSSIIFPLLLVPFAFTAFHELVPLIINVAASVAALELLRRMLVPKRDIRLAGALTSILLPLLGIGFGLYAVAFSGLEHSLHVAVSLAVMYGCMEIVENKRAQWLPWFIMLLPLVRLEGIPLAGGAILFLIFMRRRKQAAWAAGGIAVLGVMYALGTRLAGLPILPGSITTKWHVMQAIHDEGPVMKALIFHIHRSTLGNALIIILLSAVAMWMLAYVWKLLRTDAAERRGYAALFLVVASCSAAHLLFGALEVRYVIYVFFIPAAFTLRMVRVLLERRERGISRSGYLAFGAAGVALLVLLGWNCFFYTVHIPLGASNIFRQQRQMGVFVRDYLKMPVAVNDLGCVSMDNTAHVLDLAGLNTSDVRRAREMYAPGKWMSVLCSARRPAMALIYDEWFSGMVPGDWVKVARLRLEEQCVSPAGSVVAFYAMPWSDRQAIDSALVRFRAVLPRRTSLELL